MGNALDPARFKWVFYIDPVLFPFRQQRARRSAIRTRPPTCRARPRCAGASRRRRVWTPGCRRPRRLSGLRHRCADQSPAARRRGGEVRGRLLPILRLRRSDAGRGRRRLRQVPPRWRARRGRLHAVPGFRLSPRPTECGRLHLPVHIHSSAGAGDYFDLAGVNVLNLEPVLRDQRYAATTFVLIHGGYPFERAGDPHGVVEERVARLVGDRQLPAVSGRVRARAAALVRDPCPTK